MVQNKGLIYKEIPDGTPETPKHLAVEAREFDLDAAPPAGGVTTRNLVASFDPYQRGRMRRPEIKSYNEPFTLGKPIENTTIATVIKSDHADFKEGDTIIGPLPTEEYSIASAKLLQGGRFRKLQNPHNLDPELYLGALGMPGLTAYSSLYEIGKPKKGETIFISSAAGAVGGIVGQLAKHEGLRVIGSVGDDKKLELILKEYGFDDGFNYKKEKPRDALKRLAPNGIDIYYDNVGGETLDAALESANDFGRVVVCGMISQYSAKPEEVYGIKHILNVLRKRLTMRGFIVTDPDMGPKFAKEHQERVGAWLADGSFRSKSHITDGIDNSAEGFLGMLSGGNFGKAVVRIADPKL